MINKIYKVINNKFPRILKFVFSLRYLIFIFSVSLLLFLNIPIFFDYKNKQEIIKNYLLKNYDIEIKELKSIKFKPFPKPHLEIKNSKSNLSKNLVYEVNSLKIYPKLISIYNFNKFEVKKLKLRDINAVSDFKDVKEFIISIFKLKKNIIFQNLNFQVQDENNPVINIENINFKNFGFGRNKIDGKIFEKKFTIILSDNLKRINFDLDNTGVSTEIKINENSLSRNIKGNFKGKILKSSLKSDFIFHGDSLDLNNFFLRSKNLSFDSDGSIKIKPFFQIETQSNLKNLNQKLFQDLNFNYLINYKEFIKRINLINILDYKKKKFSKNIIDKFELKTNLSYGRLSYAKKFFISDSKFSCEGNINLLEEYPKLYFYCFVDTKDKRKLLKKFDIDYKNKEEAILLNVKGNLNILNKKINIDFVKTKQNYHASKEDIKYFKNTFENILFDQNFISMFDISKLRKFILEIS